MRSPTLFRTMARDHRTDYGFAWIRGLNITRVSLAYVPVLRDIMRIIKRKNSPRLLMMVRSRDVPRDNANAILHRVALLAECKANDVQDASVIVNFSILEPEL